MPCCQQAAVVTVHSSWCACAWHCVQRRYRVVALRRCTSSTRTRSVSSHTCSVHWQMMLLEWQPPTATRRAVHRRAALSAGYSHHTRLANKSYRSTCLVSTSRSTMHFTTRLMSDLLHFLCYFPFILFYFLFSVFFCHLVVLARGPLNGLLLFSILFPSLLWHCLLSDRMVIWPIINLCDLSLKVLFWNSWRKTYWEPVNWVHLENGH